MQCDWMHGKDDSSYNYLEAAVAATFASSFSLARALPCSASIMESIRAFSMSFSKVSSTTYNYRRIQNFFKRYSVAIMSFTFKFEE